MSWKYLCRHENTCHSVVHQFDNHVLCSQTSVEGCSTAIKASINTSDTSTLFNIIHFKEHTITWHVTVVYFVHSVFSAVLPNMCFLCLEILTVTSFLCNAFKIENKRKCEIWRSNSDDYEDYNPLECDAMQSCGNVLTFQRNLLPPPFCRPTMMTEVTGLSEMLLSFYNTKCCGISEGINLQEIWLLFILSYNDFPLM